MAFARSGVLAVIAAATVVAVAAGPAHGASKLAKRAERLVLRKAVPKALERARTVRCARQRRRRGERGRFSCRWSAERRLTPNRHWRCSGRHRVVIRRRARLRRTRRKRCAVKVAALDPSLGFNDNSVRAGQLRAERAAELTEGVGAGLHRVPLDWRVVEPQRNRYAWGEYDAIYAAMLARGVRPIFVLLFAPPWAMDQGAICLGESLCRRPPARSEYHELRQIAGMVAARYPRAAAIEVWNEPNESGFWQPHPDVARYTELLKVANLGVKQANPRMTVLTGGFSSRSTSGSGYVSLREFTHGVYAHGGKGSFDGLGFHAYPFTPALEQVRSSVAEVRSVRNSFGDSAVPLWVTETGITTTGYGQPYNVSEGVQARVTVETYRLLKAERDIRSVVFHSLIDPGTDPSDRESGYGLLRFDGSAKPAYCALVSELRTGTPCP